MTMGHDDKVTWEQDSWAAGVEHGKQEAETSVTKQHAAELKLISTLLSGLKMSAEAMQARMDAMHQEMVQTAASLARIEAGLGLDGASPGEPHVIEPAPSRDVNPIFDVGGREIDMGAPGESLGYPLFSTCRCGRQIFQPAYGDPWQHSD